MWGSVTVTIYRMTVVLGLKWSWGKYEWVLKMENVSHILLYCSRFVCKSLANGRTQEIRMKTISSERTVRFVQSFQYSEEYPPELRKVSDTRGWTQQSNFMRTEETTPQAYIAQTPSSAGQACGPWTRQKEREVTEQSGYSSRKKDLLLSHTPEACRAVTSFGRLIFASMPQVAFQEHFVCYLKEAHRVALYLQTFKH